MQIHKCTLPNLSLSGLPELAPQAGVFDKFLRKFKKIFLVSKGHYQSKLVFRSINSIHLERKRHLSVSSWYIIHPYSLLSIIVQYIMTVSWMVSFVFEPILDAFYDVQTRPTTYIDVICQITINIHRVFILICFIRGYVVYKTTEVVLSPKSIAINYVKTYFFIDVIGCLPVERVVLFLGDTTAIGIMYSIIRRLKVFRMITLISFLKTIVSYVSADDTQYILISLAILTVYIIHWLTCYFYWIPRRYFTAEGEYFSKSWITLLNISTDHWTWKYINGLHYIIAHFMCSGTGQYQLEDNSEMMLATLSTIVGYFFMMVSMAFVLQILTSHGASENKYEELISTLDIIAVKKKLPPLIKQRMFKYYEHKFQGHYFKEISILHTLSEHLNYELILHSCRQLIKRVPIFHGLSKMVIGRILASLSDEIYLTNDVVFDTQSAGENMYFVAYGCIALYTLEGIELGHMIDSTFFGAICILLEEFKQNMLAVAVEPTQLFILSKPDFLKLYQRHSDFAEKVRTHIEQQLDFFDRTLASTNKTRNKFDIMHDIRRGKVLERNRKRNMT